MCKGVLRGFNSTVFVVIYKYLFHCLLINERKRVNRNLLLLNIPEFKYSISNLRCQRKSWSLEKTKFCVTNHITWTVSFIILQPRIPFITCLVSSVCFVKATYIHISRLLLGGLFPLFHISFCLDVICDRESWSVESSISK